MRKTHFRLLPIGTMSERGDLYRIRFRLYMFLCSWVHWNQLWNRLVPMNQRQEGARWTLFRLLPINTVPKWGNLYGIRRWLRLYLWPRVYRNQLRNEYEWKIVRMTSSNTRFSLLWVSAVPEWSNLHNIRHKLHLLMCSRIYWNQLRNRYDEITRPVSMSGTGNLPLKDREWKGTVISIEDRWAVQNIIID